MNQNNEPDWRTGGLAAWRMQGHARMGETIAARGRRRQRRQPGQWAKYSSGQWKQQQQRLGPLDLLGDLRPNKNKKCRQGGCMQHLVFAWPACPGLGKDEKDTVSRGTGTVWRKTLQDAAVCHVLYVSASVAA